ncbi:MAG: hypothetical protein JXA25_02085 [Anaerolineales bacterium]|nr:hypothetical protein [Anaerolineales bacterium]
MFHNLLSVQREKESAAASKPESEKSGQKARPGPGAVRFYPLILLLLLSVLFGLYDLIAKIALESEEGPDFVDTASKLRADYSPWELDEQVSISSEFLSAIRDEGSSGMEPFYVPTIENAEKQSFLLPSGGEPPAAGETHDQVSSTSEPDQTEPAPNALPGDHRSAGQTPTAMPSAGETFQPEYLLEPDLTTAINED